MIFLVCCAFCAGLCTTCRKYRDQMRAGEAEYEGELNERTRTAVAQRDRQARALVALQPQVVAAIAVTDDMPMVEVRGVALAAEPCNPHRGSQREVRLQQRFRSFAVRLFS